MLVRSKMALAVRLHWNPRLVMAGRGAPRSFLGLDVGVFGSIVNDDEELGTSASGERVNPRGANICFRVDVTHGASLLP